jgi:hypothetical protein
MIMCISLYHSLIQLNKNPTPGSLGSPSMHKHLDANSGQWEELGVQSHPRTTRGFTGPKSFVHLFDLLCIAATAVLVCFLHGKGSSTYKNHPIASPLFTPSYKLSFVPPLSTQTSKLSFAQKKV